MQLVHTYFFSHFFPVFKAFRESKQLQIQLWIKVLRPAKGGGSDFPRHFSSTKLWTKKKTNYFIREGWLASQPSHHLFLIHFSTIIPNSFFSSKYSTIHIFKNLHPPIPPPSSLRLVTGQQNSKNCLTKIRNTNTGSVANVTLCVQSQCYPVQSTFSNTISFFSNWPRKYLKQFISFKSPQYFIPF